MSYEGYEEMLCANGHLRMFDCYNHPELHNDAEKCGCGAVYVFIHSVDETNCQGEPYAFEVEEEAAYIVCNLGHPHMTRETRYKIPNVVKGV